MKLLQCILLGAALGLAGCDSSSRSPEQNSNSGGSGSNPTPQAVDDFRSATSGTTITIAPLSNDGQLTASTMIISAVGPGLGETIAIAPDGLSIDYTSAAGFTGSQAITYTIQNEFGNTSTAVITVQVVGTSSSPPIAADDIYVVSNDGSTHSLSAFGNDVDLTGAVMVNSFTQPPGGMVTATATGFDYTPNGGFAGQDNFTYDIVDGLGQVSGTATVTISVLPGLASIRPIATPDVLIHQNDGNPFQYNIVSNDLDTAAMPPLVVIDTRATPADMWVRNGGPATTAAGGTVSLNGDGTISYTPPSPTYVGPDSFQYQIRNTTTTMPMPDGTESDPAAPGIVIITVVPASPVPVPPVPVADVAIVTNDGDPSNAHGSETLSMLLINDIPPSGVMIDSVSYQDAMGNDVNNGMGGNATVSIVPGGTGLIYNPNPGFVGVDTFILTYTITDGTTMSQVSAPVAVTVIPPLDNVPPVPLPDLFADGMHCDAADLTIGAGDDVYIDAKCNDLDGGDGDGDATTSPDTITILSVDTVVLAGSGTASKNMETPADVHVTVETDPADLAAGSQIRVNSTATAAGILTIEYTITDGTSPNVAPPGLITVLIQPPGTNQPPIANADTAATGVCATPGTEPDGMGGNQSFTNNFVADTNGMIKINVLCNDVDLENDALTATGITMFTYAGPGTVAEADLDLSEFASHGNIIFTPDAADESGIYQISYSLQDSQGNAAPLDGQVIFTITPISTNIAPVGVADTALTNTCATAGVFATTAGDGTMKTIDVLCNDIDPDSNPVGTPPATLDLTHGTNGIDNVTFVGVNPTVMTFSGNLDVVGNQIQYDAGSHTEAGTLTFTYVANDGGAANNTSAPTTVTILINAAGANACPTGVADNAATNNGTLYADCAGNSFVLASDSASVQTYTIDLLCNDIDIDDLISSVNVTSIMDLTNTAGVSTAVPVDADMANGNNESVTVDVSPNTVGEYTFTYVPDDGQPHAAPCVAPTTVTINVLPAAVNVPPSGVADTGLSEDAMHPGHYHVVANDFDFEGNVLNIIAADADPVNAFGITVMATDPDMDGKFSHIQVTSFGTAISGVSPIVIRYIAEDDAGATTCLDGMETAFSATCLGTTLTFTAP